MRKKSLKNVEFLFIEGISVKFSFSKGEKKFSLRIGWFPSLSFAPAILRAPAPLHWQGHRKHFVFTFGVTTHVYSPRGNGSNACWGVVLQEVQPSSPQVEEVEGVEEGPGRDSPTGSVWAPSCVGCLSSLTTTRPTGRSRVSSCGPFP